MLRTLLTRYVLLAGLMSVFVMLSAQAQEVQVELARPPLPFLSADAAATVDMKIESSAVEPIGDGRLLLVADDENKSLLIVEAETGRLKGQLKLGTFDKKPKWEAMARDDEGAYYVASAFSVKDPTESDAGDKLKARLHLLRFRLKGVGTDGALPTLEDGSVIEWDLTDALAIEGYSSDPRQNKVKIEGLAIRTLRDPKTNAAVRELLIGLRQPTAPVRVYAADISQLPAPNTKLGLRPLFKFDAGSREGVASQLSSLEYVPAWKGFLILTSTEDSGNRFHGNTLWFLADEKISASLPKKQRAELRLKDLRLVEPQKVWLFGLNSKAEGLCVIAEEPAQLQSNASAMRLALVYDNDTETTSIASTVQLLTLVRWPK